MPADASIFQQYLQPVRSVADYSADMDKAESNKLALAASRLSGKQAELAAADDAAYRQASMSSGGDTNKLVQALYAGGQAKQAQAIQAAGLANAKTSADTKMANSHASLFEQQAGASKQEQQYSAALHHAQSLAYVQTPEDVQGYISQGIAKGVFPPMTPEQIQQKLAQYPTVEAFKQAAQQAAIPVLDRYKVEAENSRNAATNATSIATNKLTNDTSRQNNAATVGASIANNRATIAKDFTIAGIGADGAPSSTVESMAQQIAKGTLPPITGFALAKPQGQMVMSRVAAINPDYDATSYGAKVKAAKDFSTGSQGNAMRSFAVAGDHLDQLGKLVDALDNGNMQVVNKVGNYIATQTGSPAPTNFDAAKDVVSKEVIKAIVGGGGGVAERQELSHLMSGVSSPAQLKGVITQYSNLMAAQHAALLQQRQAAGLPDSTLPKYKQEGGAPAAGGVPADVAAALAKHGVK